MMAKASTATTRLRRLFIVRSASLAARADRVTRPPVVNDQAVFSVVVSRNTNDDARCRRGRPASASSILLTGAGKGFAGRGGPANQDANHGHGSVSTREGAAEHQVLVGLWRGGRAGGGEGETHSPLAAASAWRGPERDGRNRDEGRRPSKETGQRTCLFLFCLARLRAGHAWPGPPDPRNGGCQEPHRCTWQGKAVLWFCRHARRLLGSQAPVCPTWKRQVEWSLRGSRCR
ncbi:hypothetical protein VUR80DRAFT_6434 [Thermomyces stellatus]